MVPETFKCITVFSFCPLARENATTIFGILDCHLKQEKWCVFLLNLLLLFQQSSCSSWPSICTWCTSNRLVFKWYPEIREYKFHLFSYIVSWLCHLECELRFGSVFVNGSCIILETIAVWSIEVEYRYMHQSLTILTDPNDQAMAQRVVLPWQKLVTT